MNILHICNKVPFPGRDGSSIAMESLIRLEALAGHRVIVLALNTDKHFVNNPSVPAELKSQVEIHSLFIKIKPGIKSLLSNWGREESYFASRFYLPEMAALVRKFIQEKKFELVVFDSLFSTVYFEDAVGVPRILRAHNVEHIIWERHLQVMNNGAKKIFVNKHTDKLKEWESNIVSKMDGIWAISEDDKRIISAYTQEDKIKYLPCTFDASKQWGFSGAESSNSYHLGAMDWAPNIRGMEWFLKDVWPKVKTEDRPEFSVVSRVKPATFSEYLQGIDWITERVEENWFSAQGILVAPLLSGSGMRIKLLEGMARGKAILTTSIGAEGLGAIHGKHIHLEDTAAGFATALLKLTSDSTYRIGLGEEARKLALSRFADEAYTPQISQNINEWLG